MSKIRWKVKGKQLCGTILLHIFEENDEQYHLKAHKLVYVQHIVSSSFRYHLMQKNTEYLLIYQIAKCITITSNH